jgi:hypothetical protein
VQSIGICSNRRACESWQVHLVFPFNLQTAVIERDHSIQYSSRVGQARQHLWSAVESAYNEGLADARAAIVAVICDPVFNSLDEATQSVTDFLCACFDEVSGCGRLIKCAGHCDNDTKHHDVNYSDGGRAFAVRRIASRLRSISAEIRPKCMIARNRIRLTRQRGCCLTEFQKPIDEDPIHGVSYRYSSTAQTPS